MKKPILKVISLMLCLILLLAVVSSCAGKKQGNISGITKNAEKSNDTATVYTISFSDGSGDFDFTVSAEDGSAISIKDVKSNENGELLLVMSTGETVNIGKVSPESDSQITGASINAKNELAVSVSGNTEAAMAITLVNAKTITAVSTTDGILNVTLDSGKTVNLGKINGSASGEDFTPYELALANGYAGTFSEWVNDRIKYVQLQDDLVPVTNYVNPNEEVDMAAKINEAITANPGKVLYFPDGNYYVKSTISVPADMSLQLDGYANIIAMTGFSESAVIDFAGSSIEGGTIDGNNIAAKGISISGGKGPVIEGVSITNAKQGLCIGTAASYARVENVNIACTSASDSIGLLCEANNNTLKLIRVNDAKTGVKITGQRNTLTQVSLTRGTDAAYSGSIGCIETAGANAIDECRSYQYETAFQLLGTTASTYTSCFAVWNKDEGVQKAFNCTGTFNSVISYPVALFSHASGNVFFTASANGTGMIVAPSYNTSTASLSTGTVQLGTNTIGNISEALDAEDLNTYDFEKYLSPVWSGTVSYAETAFVREQSSSSTSVADIQLLYDIEDVISVRSFDLKTVYTEGVDYTVSNGKLKILSGGSIPVMSYSKYYGDVVLVDGKFNQQQWAAGATGKGYFFGDLTNTIAMADYTICVTYSHSEGTPFTVPEDKSDSFSKLMEKIENFEPINIVSLGDSITAGWSASGSLVDGKTPESPYAPAYNNMLAEYITKTYGVAVNHTNLAIGGQTSSSEVMNGLTAMTAPENLEEMCQADPDIVIIAIGMNDGYNGISSTQHVTNIKKALTKLKEDCPDAMAVVITTSLPNHQASPENGGSAVVNIGKDITLNSTTDPYNYRRFGEALRAEEANWTNAVLADVMAVNLELYDRKQYQDISGNNYNHPNDYMHRIYAQVVIQTIFGYATKAD